MIYFGEKIVAENKTETNDFILNSPLLYLYSISDNHVTPRNRGDYGLNWIHDGRLTRAVLNFYC